MGGFSFSSGECAPTTAGSRYCVPQKFLWGLLQEDGVPVIRVVQSLCNQLELRLNSWFKVELLYGACWTLPGLPLVSDPVC